MKITGYNPDFSFNLVSGSVFASAGGDLSGQFPGPLVTGIWGVSIACNTAPTTGQVLTALSPTLIGWATPSNSAAFGSNSTRVSANPSAGASASNARADHIHDGIGTVTASPSNTMDRGTFNLRAGSNITFGLTDSDGSGGLDTVTVNASVPGGGVTSIAKSGSTALTGAVTLTAGSNVTLTQAGNDISIASTGGGGGLTLIGSTVLGAAAGTIDVSGISSSYKDLVIVIRARGTVVGPGLGVNLRVGNGTVDSGNNYSYYEAYVGFTSGNNNSTIGTSSMPIFAMTDSTSVAGSFANCRIELLNYADTGKFKGVIGQGFSYDSGGILYTDVGGVWRNASSAVDIVRILPSSGNFDIGSAMYVYGRG